MADTEIPVESEPKKKAKVVKDKLLKKTPANAEANPVTALSSGSTLLNLAMTGNPNVCFFQGFYYVMIGDSRAGKTWLALQLFAEAAKNDRYAKHRFIYDKPERGALMDVARYFGQGVKDRMEEPSKRGSSRSLEDFYDNVDDAALDGRPFIYVLDSEDALVSEKELKKFRQDKNKRHKKKGDAEGKEDELKGSYGTAKAKTNSSGLRVANDGLAGTASILVVLKQSRDNIGPDAMFRPKTRSGGRSLTFYATGELWFSIVKKIVKKVKGNPVVQGSVLRIKNEKNRTSGTERTVELPFHVGHGIDEIGSLIRFLVKWQHWEGSEDKGLVKASEFEFEGKQDDLAVQIEADGKEAKLRTLVCEVWDDIEDQLKVKRKARYA